MRIYTTLQRELSQIEKNTIDHFRYYYDSKKSFALIGDYVVAVLSDEHSGNIEELKKEAAENITQLLNTPPDFTTYVMDDGYGLVEMNYGIYAVSPEKLSDNEILSGKVDIKTALAIRSEILNACEVAKIIAINDEEL